MSENNVEIFPSTNSQPLEARGNKNSSEPPQNVCVCVCVREIIIHTLVKHSCQATFVHPTNISLAPSINAVSKSVGKC